MINEHDIKDMKPERKMQDGKPLASNHIGWNVVEWLEHSGWVVLEGPFETLGNAKAVRDILANAYPNSEIGIYEALKVK